MHLSIKFGSIIGQSAVILTIVSIEFSLAQSIYLFKTLSALPLNKLILLSFVFFLNLSSIFFLVVHKKIFFTNLVLFNLLMHRSITSSLVFNFKKCLFGNLLDPDLAARKIAILFFFSFILLKNNQKDILLINLYL